MEFKLRKSGDGNKGMDEVDYGQMKALVEQVHMCSTFQLENVTTCFKGCTRQGQSREIFF